MSRRKKGKQTGAAKIYRAPTTSYGLDYGLLPFGAALGSLEFPKRLTDAQVVAVAYGQAPDESMRSIVPAVTLVGKNEKPLVEAFREFAAWSDATDGDALEVTFVFLNSGGYLLALSPEPRRLEQRCMGYARTLRVISYSAIWIKRMDTVHPVLRQMRQYSATFPAPFLFGAATLPQHISSADDARPDMINDLKGARPLLKFESHFIDESDVRPGTNAWVALKSSSTARSRRSPGNAKRTGHLVPTEVFQFRERMLRTHFPVTLERMVDVPSLLANRQALRVEGFRDWQIHQAICNATGVPPHGAPRLSEAVLHLPARAHGAAQSLSRAKRGTWFAHILPDRHPKGEPIVTNGLGLCTIQHSAYDANIIGIDPEARVHVRVDILREKDGPMLKHGLQKMAGCQLVSSQEGRSSSQPGLSGRPIRPIQCCVASRRIDLTCSHRVMEHRTDTATVRDADLASMVAMGARAHFSPLQTNGRS